MKERAKVVLYIFQQYALGKIVKDIISELTGKGIIYHGKPFKMNTIYSMLRFEKYIGICRHPDGTCSSNIYPPIIPKPLFDKVQTILELNKIGSKSNGVEFMLKGKCLCGYRKNNLQGESGTSHTGAVKYYYKCSRRKKLNICNKEIIPKENLENLVIKSTLSTIGNPETVSFLADEIMKVHAKRMYDKSLLTMLTNENDNIKSRCQIL